MEAKDARLNAYEFYKNEINAILRQIEDASAVGEMSLQISDVPKAIDCYLYEKGFTINRYSTGDTSIITILWVV